MFKPGQKVRCVDGFEGFLLQGATYTIRDSRNCGREIVRLIESPLMNMEWFASRFFAYDNPSKPSRPNKPVNKSLSRALHNLNRQGLRA